MTYHSRGGTLVDLEGLRGRIEELMHTRGMRFIAMLNKSIAFNPRRLFMILQLVPDHSRCFDRFIPNRVV